MREISLDTNVVQLPRNTFLIYGDSRTGKTTFLGTFPRVLILADATEQGWESLRNVPDESLFESGVKPIIWGIEEVNDIPKALDKAAPLIASGQIQTIGFDSLTFYTELYLAFITRQQAAAGKQDNRQAYGLLGMHLRDIRTRIHSLPVNVAWLCLAKHPESEDPVGGPMIPGQQAAKFMAGCHYILHTRLDQKREAGKVVTLAFEIRTRPYNSYIAGHRLGDKGSELPDPFVGTYADFITCLGYDAQAIRAALPPIVAKGSAVVRPHSPKSPVVVTVPPAAGNHRQQAPRAK